MPNVSRTNILLVESEQVLADLVSFRLELLGYSIHHLESGAELVNFLQQNEINLIVLNSKLVDGDGLEWLARIRGEHTADHVPTLVMSLDPSLETVERAFHAGAQDYLITPFDPTVLESKIHSLLARRVETGRKRQTAS
jgi:DNA-binding response OmpR family regulator